MRKILIWDDGNSLTVFCLDSRNWMQLSFALVGVDVSSVDIGTHTLRSLMIDVNAKRNDVVVAVFEVWCDKGRRKVSSFVRSIVKSLIKSFS